MSPSQARVRTLYLLITLNIVLLAATAALALYVANLRSDFQDAQQQSYAGCLRGNVIREITRYAMEELGSPERARLPEVQQQNCASLYPGGTP